MIFAVRFRSRAILTLKTYLVEFLAALSSSQHSFKLRTVAWLGQMWKQKILVDVRVRTHFLLFQNCGININVGPQLHANEPSMSTIPAQYHSSQCPLNALKNPRIAITNRKSSFTNPFLYTYIPVCSDEHDIRLYYRDSRSRYPVAVDGYEPQNSRLLLVSRPLYFQSTCSVSSCKYSPHSEPATILAYREGLSRWSRWNICVDV